MALLSPTVAAESTQGRRTGHQAPAHASRAPTPAPAMTTANALRSPRTAERWRDHRRGRGFAGRGWPLAVEESEARIWSVAAPRYVHRVMHGLVQDVVLASAGDLEIGGRRTEWYEAVSLKNPLGADVVPQGCGLNAVQAKRSTCEIHDFSHRSGAETPAVVP
jgi:hypothetical protein